MRGNVVGDKSPEFVKAGNKNSGRVQDVTSKVRTILNSAQSAMSNVAKASKSACKGC